MRRNTVTIHHPKTGGVSHVDPRSVPIWQSAGWVEGEPKPSTPRRTRRGPQTPANPPETPDAGASTTEEE